MLVLPDEHADVAAELCQLQAEEAAGRVAPGATSAVVRLVAAVLRFLRQRQAAEAAGVGSAAAVALDMAYPPAAAARLASAACYLVMFSVAARWPQLAALVLPAVIAGGSSPAAAAQQMAGLAAPAGSPLLLALASGSAPSVAALRGWAAGHGLGWDALQPAAAGDAAAGSGGSQAAAAAEADAALDDLLLLAAAMGSSLDGDMVQQLTGECISMGAGLFVWTAGNRHAMHAWNSAMHSLHVRSVLLWCWHAGNSSLPSLAMLPS